MTKILIVDDSNFSQKINSNLLKKYIEDVQIFFADDGKEGFKKYTEINPDYVFVDLLMPKINGKDLIALIREYDADAKIAIVSADVQKAVKEEVEAFNIMAFINKPFNEEKAQYICDMIKDDKNGQ